MDIFLRALSLAGADVPETYQVSTQDRDEYHSMAEEYLDEKVATLQRGTSLPEEENLGTQQTRNGH